MHYRPARPFFGVTGKARVAVARKLAIVMHAMWRDGTFYVGDPDATAQDIDASNAAKLQRLSLANS